MNQAQQAVLADAHSQHNAARPVQTHKDRTITHLPIADILRGLAASWVFLFHASEGGHIDGLARILPEMLTNIVFSAGHLGVAVFFVLSGLVIAMSGERCGDGLIPAANFLARRLTRLAPPYYLSLVVVLAYLLLKKKFEPAGVTLPEPSALAAHLLFLQDALGIQALNSVYWTLCIEIQFYFAFCFLMLLIRWSDRNFPANFGWFAIMGIACTIAAFWPIGLAYDKKWDASFLPTWHLFLLGVVLRQALKEGRFVAAPYVIYLSVLTVAAIANKNIFTLAGIGTSVVLYAFARLPAYEAWARFRLLTKLGTISYSFYLLHNPITGAAFNITRRLIGGDIAAEVIGLMISFCVCVFFSAISYMIVERPAIQWGRQFRT